MSEQSHTQQAIRNKILSQHFLFTFVLFNDFVTDGFQNGQWKIQQNEYPETDGKEKVKIIFCDILFF
mgnify:FL=1